MNSRLSLALSEFSKGGWATEPSNEPPLHPTERNLIMRPLAFARVLMIFSIGFAAGIAWQSYGGAVRKAIAGWSPRLAWVAPAAVPGGTSPERLKAMSLALAAARQNLDKLATEISKLPAQDGDAPRRRATR